MCRTGVRRHARAFELTQKFVLAVLWRGVSIDLYGKRSSFGRVKAVIPARSGGQKPGIFRAEPQWQAPNDEVKMRCYAAPKNCVRLHSLSLTQTFDVAPLGTQWLK